METFKLFENYKLNNNVEVPGRLVIGPMTVFGSNKDGTINDEEREYLKLRATGIGLYILGATAVSQEGIGFDYQPLALSEKDLPSLKERAEIIKNQGALAINQIYHCGLSSVVDISGLDPLAPSAEIANQLLKEKKQFKSEVKEFTDEQIKKTINDFAYSTELCLKAGFDVLKSMVRIITYFNNFILHILIEELMNGVVQMRKE